MTNFDEDLKNKLDSLHKLVSQKNKAYGDSIASSEKIFSLLYPNGIKVSQYKDILLVIRILDKISRIANDKEAFGENAFEDIVGYAIRGCMNGEKDKDVDPRDVLPEQEYCEHDGGKQGHPPPFCEPDGLRMCSNGGCGYSAAHNSGYCVFHKEGPSNPLPLELEEETYDPAYYKRMREICECSHLRATHQYNLNEKGADCSGECKACSCPYFCETVPSTSYADPSVTKRPVDSKVTYIDLGPPPAYKYTFGDDRVCTCTHTYVRHFDTYEAMAPVGCKYCECDRYHEPVPGKAYPIPKKVPTKQPVSRKKNNKGK